MIDIASYIDHTILKPVTIFKEIRKLCTEAVEYRFAAVCVPPPLVLSARKVLAELLVSGAGNGLQRMQPKVATVIGFPFGYSTLHAKLAETEQSIADGAEELDVVINLIALKNGDWDYLAREMAALTERIHSGGKILKVIIESGMLEEGEIIRCCEIYGALGVDFLKTSTGYAEKGATLEALKLMRERLPASIRLKASGGIRDYPFARQLVAAGADRLGCSASVEIVAGQQRFEKGRTAEDIGSAQSSDKIDY